MGGHFGGLYFDGSCYSRKRTTQFGMETTKQNRDWKAEQAALLSALAPEWHFHRVFDGLPEIYFFAKNKRG